MVYLPVLLHRGANDFLWEVICTNVAAHGDSIATGLLDLVDDRLSLPLIDAEPS